MYRGYGLSRFFDYRENWTGAPPPNLKLVFLPSRGPAGLILTALNNFCIARDLRNSTIGKASITFQNRKSR